MLTPDEERALEYQKSIPRRLAFQRSLQAKLKPPGEPFKVLLKNWSPLRRNS